MVRDVTVTENAAAAGTIGRRRSPPAASSSTEVLVGDAEQRDFAQGVAFALAFLFYLVLRSCSG